MKFFIPILIFFSSVYTNQISFSSDGNLEKLSLMNSRSYIDNILSYQKNSINFSFIQYPEEVQINQASYTTSINSYTIQSRFLLLNWGTLQATKDNGDVIEFEPSEKLIELSILKELSNELFFGTSIKYLSSNIDLYNSKYLVQDIGVSKILFNNRFQIGFSIENIMHKIKKYSNINDIYNYQTNIGFSYYPSHTDGGLYINYITEKNASTEIIIGVKNKIKNHFNLYFGKSFYLKNLSLGYSIYDNFSLGIDIMRSKYKVNMGIQYLGDMGIILGSSISILIK